MRLSGRSWWVAGGVLLAVAGGTWRLWVEGTRGAEIANVLALPVSLLGLAIAAIGLWAALVSRRDQVGAAVADLAEELSREEAAALAQLLGETGDPQPANVGFDRLALVRWRNDGGDRQGNLAQIGAYYGRLDRGRLVVLGRPGSGKTVLAVHLVLDLLRTRPTAPGPKARVPVRLSLPAFDSLLGDDGEQVSDRILKQRLDDWLAAQLVQRGLSRSNAEGAVKQGWILPVLDGLDEMDPDDTPPLRAAAVIRALNATADPVVLTCRRERYDQLLGTASAQAVQDATTVMLEPLSPATVREYLTYLFPDPTHPTRIAAHWRATARALDRATPSPFITALCSPWQLYLCRTAFADPSQGDPHTQLAELAPDELNTELLRRLIPAAVANHTGPRGERHDADSVKRWLITLARTSPQSGSSSDILLHQLGTAVGSRAPRYIIGLALAVLVTLPLLLLIGLPYLEAVGFPPDTPQAWYGLFSSVLLVGGVGLRASASAPSLNRIDLSTRRRRRDLVSQVAFWIVGGLVVGLMIWLAFGLAFGPRFGFKFGLTVGIGAGLAVGLAVGLALRPSYIRAPSDLARQGITHDTVVTVAVGLPTGLAAGLVIDLATGFAAGLALGPAIGLALRPSPWPRYFVAVLLGRINRTLPPRPARFLDWAYTAGLVRLSGIGIQFRHREFETWLVNQSTDDALSARPRTPCT
ncbi:NACHT domain-containing protein [Actinocrispum wychmicini]|uniref:NACHT domain-containing protein n=1 Tax=Actinocrispum wychmicini TaxID=1213861 RepID=A0A4R2J9N8_9PSEU|nr:NACHT domain-containing protein [Actinocrispum wychmicini]TCO52629.1 NACHT domain-containing protein [Actinocrispum wychmicini]